ncbi:LysR family transcriptional regulator, partial [Francisella tularensis subsp. holarctica]|uniref:chlorhexidine efflux transporter n=1 Tax=Francisella tularensis TaxID=263 RepID=UPI0023819508
HRSKRGIIILSLHAFLFELVLLIDTIPLVAYILNMSFLSALLVDIGFVIFYLVDAFVDNYIVDRIYVEFIPK